VFMTYDHSAQPNIDRCYSWRTWHYCVVRVRLCTCVCVCECACVSASVPVCLMTFLSEISLHPICSDEDSLAASSHGSCFKALDRQTHHQWILLVKQTSTMADNHRVHARTTAGQGKCISCCSGHPQVGCTFHPSGSVGPTKSVLSTVDHPTRAVRVVTDNSVSSHRALLHSPLQIILYFTQTSNTYVVFVIFSKTVTNKKRKHYVDLYYEVYK